MSERQPTRQYLTFSLAGDEYLMGIQGIREVLRAERVTRVPRSSAALLGLLNLRGSVIPVVDLAAGLGLTEAGRGPHSCVIIMETDQGGQKSLVGLAVDAVSDVVELDGESLGPAPSFGTPIPAAYLQGLGKVRERFLPILDLERLMSPSELSRSAPHSVPSSSWRGAAVAPPEGNPEERLP